MQTGPDVEIADRLEWYDRKATRARAAYLATKVVELLAAAAIPVVALLALNPVLVASLGAFIAVLAGIDQLFRFQETWINYRRTAEALRNELFLFRTGAGPYGELAVGDTAGRLLANRAADLLNEEGSRWESLARQSSIPDRRSERESPAAAE